MFAPPKHQSEYLEVPMLRQLIQALTAIVSDSKGVNLVDSEKKSSTRTKASYRAGYISPHSVWKVVNSTIRDAWKLERRIMLFYYNNIIHSSFSASCPNKCFFHSSFAIISEGNSQRFMEGKCCVIKRKETDGHP